MLHPNSKTRLSEEAIARMVANNPCRLAVDASGKANGNIVTCPVRLSFLHLFEKGPPNDQGKQRWDSVLLFPFCADLSLLKSEATKLALTEWPKAGQPDGPTLHNPFRDQAEKAGKYEGYVPGSIMITAGSEQFKPPLVDQNMAPVVEESRAYPGVWAICSINPYVFGKAKDAKKRGVTWGLNTVMILLDDENIGGGAGADPNTEFAGVKIDSSINPAAGFGGEAQAAAAVPASLF